MQMGVKVDELAEGLDPDDAPGHKVVAPQQRPIDVTHRFPCQVRQPVEQVSVEAEEDPQPLGNAPDELTMRHGLAHILGDVDTEQQSPLLMATGADAPLLAGEGDEELVAAVGASDSGKALSQVAAPEELFNGFGNDWPPKAELASIALGLTCARMGGRKGEAGRGRRCSVP